LIIIFFFEIENKTLIETKIDEKQDVRENKKWKGKEKEIIHCDLETNTNNQNQFPTHVQNIEPLRPAFIEHNIEVNGDSSLQKISGNRYGFNATSQVDTLPLVSMNYTFLLNNVNPVYLNNKFFSYYFGFFFFCFLVLSFLFYFFLRI